MPKDVFALLLNILEPPPSAMSSSTVALTFASGV